VTVYKADLKTNFYYIIGFVILFGVTILLSPKFSNNGWLCLIAFLSLFFLYNLFTSRLNEIHIDKTNGVLVLIYKNYFGIRKTKKLGLTNIKFAYKRQKTSFRGGIKNVCSLYISDRKIAQLAPDDDGWDDDEIFSFVHGLIEAGIEKKFVGYNLKDVQI